MLLASTAWPGAFSGLTNLATLDLGYNWALTELNLTDADFSNLVGFELGEVYNLTITSVSLKNTVVNQKSLKTLLDGSYYCNIDPDAQVAVSDLSANVGAGTVVVHGDGSRWNFRQGEFGTDGVGAISVQAGGRIAATADVTVGLNSTSQGSLQVTGSGALANSLVSVGNDLIVGDLGQGTLTVDLGGAVTVGDDLLVGGDPSNLNDNVVNITNPGSSIMVADRLQVGSAGVGTLNITDGATVLAHSVTTGELPSGNGHIALSGAESKIIAAYTAIGSKGPGSLTISEGARFESGPGRFWVAFNGAGDGVVDVKGPESTLAITSAGDLVVLQIGGETNSTGGKGSLTVSDGGKIISQNNTHIGGNASSVGSLIVTGPTSVADLNDESMDAVTVVGYAGQGSLSIFDGGQVESQIVMIGKLA